MVEVEDPSARLTAWSIVIVMAGPDMMRGFARCVDVVVVLLIAAVWLELSKLVRKVKVSPRRLAMHRPVARFRGAAWRFEN